MTPKHRIFLLSPANLAGIRAGYVLNATGQSDLACRLRDGGVPLGELAEIHQDSGPAMIRDENGLLTAYVFVDVAGPDLGTYVQDLKSALARVRVPSGYSFQISGQYESLERVRRRLRLIVPLTLAVIVLLLYLNTGSLANTGIVLLAGPFSVVGAVWLMKILGYRLSIASWVGMVALMGLDAETGVFMLLYLDLAYQEAVKAHAMAGPVDLHRAVVAGAVKRLRPKMMTVTAAIAGLLPILWSTGAGADTMKRVVAPLVGGLVTSFLLELVVYPVLFALWKRPAGLARSL